jgi:periplasmic divalent cation tolerance protein
MEDAILILSNMPDPQTARVIARNLVEARLAACVNILPAVRSVYRWQNEIEEAEEVTLLVKTVTTRYADVEAEIKAAHPYQVPEIIALPIVDGLPEYLAWIANESKKDVNV